MMVSNTDVKGMPIIYKALFETAYQLKESVSLLEVTLPDFNQEGVVYGLLLSEEEMVVEMRL